MKKTIIFLLLIITTSCKTKESVINTRNISGVVHDEQGLFPGVDVQVIRDNKTVSGTTTDMDGNFIVEGMTGDILVVNIDTYPDKGIKAIIITEKNNYTIKLGDFNSFSNKRIKRVVKREMKRRMIYRMK
ncbi:MAG: hypothetical protein ACK4IX_17385 [Candidatus Sericytochromatia bacterium]